MSILNPLELNEAQREAATAPGDVVVTAGAGSGKTRTLVARYLARLENGVPLRAIVAITFTVKAAREMRTRIRRTLTGWLERDECATPPERWRDALAELDAAHIGTLHSLCAQILRAHPVEAARLGHLPGFGVLEEGRAAVLQARAIEEALVWAAEDEAASRLFNLLGEFPLRRAITTLLEQRLDTQAAFERLTDDPLEGWADAVLGWLRETLRQPGWQAPLTTFAELQADDPADKMELARQEVLAHAAAVDAALARGDLAAALAELAGLRDATTLYGRKGNWPGDTLETMKEATRALRDFFDEKLKPLADPKRGAAWALDEQVSGVIWTIHAAYRRALDAYTEAKQAENALDFDDLEAGALALLQDDDVRAFWQETVQAVLVDEFQDTNERQREIVYALSGFTPQAPADPGPDGSSLFVVGDAKQSIYRFRGADVTVFRRVQDDVRRAGGRPVALDVTFRPHRALVTTLNRLLAPVMNELARPGRPYAVPFAPLTAYRADPRTGVTAPFVEFHLGLGQSAHEGRQAAADGLAARLHQLHDEEGIAWQDVALLFRASTTFPVYEDALERAGIPFVTVAGRGFYDRPEVRTLLNALLAVAEPTDDLALVGFLRSPAVGLSDAALYLLRFPPPSIVPRDEETPCSIWAVLNHPALAEIVPEGELARAVQGRALIEELHDLAGRVPVASLLKRLLDQTVEGAALGPSAGRARRNLEKLLADAHASGLVSVRTFLEYVEALRDVGARESEAPTEAGSAVQLMTVHKAKGLEFPIVVIADAAHGGHWGAPTLLPDERLGVTLKLRDDDDHYPAAYRLAKLRDDARDEAENRRLLYVAATRAQEKLLISGHTKILKGGRLSLRGWLDLLGLQVGLDDVTLAGTPLAPQPLELAPDVGCTVHPWHEERPIAGAAAQPPSRVKDHVSDDLIAPLMEPAPLDEVVSEAPQRIWRVVTSTERAHAPAWVVGKLTHVALRYWRFDPDGLDAFLRPFALGLGVVNEATLRDAIRETAHLLQRFRNHPLWEALDGAERRHEVPFDVVEDGNVTHGIIDLLYRTGDAPWTLVEFKTDRLEADVDLSVHSRDAGYAEQVQRYVRAAQELGLDVDAILVFLNVGGDVKTLRVA
jgi:ATP-dependent helicase/nuclease subunit A